jgi:hypothetical protein
VQPEAGERTPLSLHALFVCRLLFVGRVLMAAVLIALPLAQASAAEQNSAPAPPQTEANAPAQVFGALAFTADGSFSSAWKSSSKEDVEAKVRAECAAFNRGRCELILLPQDLCAAIATFRRGTHKATYSGGALAPDDAKRLALQRCSSDARSGGQCQLRTVVCGDGR